MAPLRVALAILAASMPLANATLCSKSAFDASYPPIKALMDACANKTGIPLARPMENSQKRTLCAACTQLVEVVKAETAVPDCNVPEADGSTTKLLKLLQRLLRPCVGGSSASDSSAGSQDTDDSTTTTPTPTTPISSSTKPSANDSLSSDSSMQVTTSEGSSFACPAC